MSVVGSNQMSAIAVALGQAADGAEAVETRTSNAEREKEEAKAVAFDPLNVIHEALQKIDEAILRTIDENQQLKV